MPQIRFNTKIYNKEAIREAVSDYSHLARFSIKEARNYIKVSIDRINMDGEENIVHEFGNYVLGLTKRCL